MEASSALQQRASLTSQPPTPSQPSLRADAARNRERILAAAEDVFVERGADTSLDDVAKRAGVGIGTLYRRFPTREALLAGLSDERLLALAEASRRRDETHDPLQAIRTFVLELVRHASHYRGLAASLGAVLHSGTPGCQASSAEGQRLLQRAQELGMVRSDITFNDVVCVVTAVALVAEQGASSAARVTHLVDIFTSGITKR